MQQIIVGENRAPSSCNRENPSRFVRIHQSVPAESLSLNHCPRKNRKLLMGNLRERRMEIGRHGHRLLFSVGLEAVLRTPRYFPAVYSVAEERYSRLRLTLSGRLRIRKRMRLERSSG